MALLLSMCGLFWGAHKSLAPRARTLLGGLGQATLSFFAIVTLLFVFFGECPKFCDLAKQRRKIVGGVSEVGKDDFSLYFFWRCVVFLVFFSSAAIARPDELSPSVCLTRMAIPAHLRIFCGGPEEDIGHMRPLCARDEEVAGLLCRRVEEFTAELPLTDRAVEFVAWREHGCRWTEPLMAGVVPRDLKRLFAAVRAASSRGPAKARLFVEDMVQIGGDVYARRNHRLSQIMQLPVQDRRRAVYAFLRGDTPFCLPAGRIQQRPPWNPFAGLPGNLRATFQRAPLHALLVPRSCIAHEEAMSLFPHWMAAVAQAFHLWIGSWVARDITTFREWSRVVSAQSWALVRGTKVRSPDGQSDPLLQVYANHPAVGNVMGWPREVLPVLQQPLCSLPILAVAVVLDVGTLWLYDRQVQRVIPAVTEQQSMAVLMGSKQLTRVQGDDA